MDNLSEMLTWLLEPAHFAGTLTYCAVYAGAPLVVSLAIEGLKTDRIVRGKRRFRAIEIRAMQIAVTAILGAWIGYYPGVLAAADSVDHGIAAGLFSAITLHILKAVTETRWPKLHDAVFFAEKRKRAAIQGKPFNPLDTTTTGEVGK